MEKSKEQPMHANTNDNSTTQLQLLSLARTIAQLNQYVEFANQGEQVANVIFLCLALNRFCPLEQHRNISLFFNKHSMPDAIQKHYLIFLLGTTRQETILGKNDTAKRFYSDAISPLSKISVREEAKKTTLVDFIVEYYDLDDSASAENIIDGLLILTYNSARSTALHEVKKAAWYGSRIPDDPEESQDNFDAPEEIDARQCWPSLLLNISRFIGY